MVEVIDSGEPAVMVCHWPGVYFNGERIGFNILKEVKTRLDQKYDNLVWMKLSEIASYWAICPDLFGKFNRDDINIF